MDSPEGAPSSSPEACEPPEHSLPAPHPEERAAQPLSPWAARLLGGLQAGILAGLLMMSWLMFESYRRDQPVWSNPNLVSTALLGRAGVKGSFGIATVAGFSLTIVMAGLHGMLFALLLPVTARPIWAANAGLLFAFLSYGVFFGWALEYLAPLMDARASRPTWMGGHFLFGVLLGLYPDFARALLPPTRPVADAPTADAPTASPNVLSDAPAQQE
jgi:hypothetical protein